MKKLMRKMLSVVATLAMVLTMAMPVMAASITVNNAVDGEEYKAYKLLDATYDGETVGDTTSVAYYYTGKASDELYTILAKYFQFDDFVDGKAYVKVVNDQGEKIDYSNVNVAGLAADLNTAMHRTNNPLTLTQAGTTATASDGSATISNLDKGYYFLDTSTGSLCSIDTAGNVTMYEKNSVPSVTDKKVKKDGADTYTANANGSVGDQFDFQITVNTGTNTHAADQTKTGADSDFVFTDKLGSGFTLNRDSFVVTNKSTKTVLTDNTDYTVATADGTDNDAGKTIITVTLKASAIATQNQNITVEYNAKLNEKAIDHNENATNNAEGKETRTYTYNFGLDKIDGSDQTKLAGVKFTLQNNDNKYYVAATAESPAVWQDAKNELTTDQLGHIDFKGLGAGTYTLTETETLDGYNKLDSAIKITITPSDDNSSATVTAKMGSKDLTMTGTTVTIENNKGTILPSTGGMGTTIFYVLGAALAIGAGVVLVTRRRLSR